MVGLDTNAADKTIITSRGYGAGQYTLFHHPPQPKEVTDFMLDVTKNVSKAIRELRDKFDHFIVGPTSGTQADDRIAEIGRGPLRICKYAATDARYMKDCRQCLKDAGTVDIQSGLTTLHPKTTETYQPTQYHSSGSYRGVPNRAQVGCDWPYAVPPLQWFGTEFSPLPGESTLTYDKSLGRMPLEVRRNCRHSESSIAAVRSRSAGGLGAEPTIITVCDIDEVLNVLRFWRRI